jgi:hypothetical protein
MGGAKAFAVRDSVMLMRKAFFYWSDRPGVLMWLFLQGKATAEEHFTRPGMSRNIFSAHVAAGLDHATHHIV